jgi:hypothetical protein
MLPSKATVCNSFTIPMVLVLCKFFTVTKSKGFTTTLELIANQKLSIVIGNLSETKVCPIKLRSGGFREMLSLFDLAKIFLLLMVEMIGDIKNKCCSRLSEILQARMGRME